MDIVVSVALCPKSTAMVVAGQSVHLTTLSGYIALVKKKPIFLVSARKRQAINFLFHAETMPK